MHVSGCIGPLAEANLDGLRDRRPVPVGELAGRPARRWGWELEAARRLPEPVAYRHSNKAQSWANIADQEVRSRIARRA